VGPRAGLDGRKISSPPGFDPGPSSPSSIAIPTELPGPHRVIISDIYIYIHSIYIHIYVYIVFVMENDMMYICK